MTICAQKRRIVLLYFGRCCAQKRRICDEFNIDSELKRPKASNLRLKSYCTLDAVAPKSVEFNIDSELKRPKASNLRLKSYCTLDAVAPKSVEFNIDSELKRPKASNLRRIQHRFGTEAPKSVEFAPKSYYTLGPKLLLYYLLEAIYNFISIYR